MDLGTRISRLRAAHNLSQGDLAEALSVSRQSVSKWETGASVPDLDKLIKLAQLFEISLDELVTGTPPRVTGGSPAAESSPAPAASGRSSRFIAGIVFLALAALVWLLLTALGSFLSGLFLAVPFLACGIICLRCRQRAALWCVWVFYLFVELYIRWGTGISWSLVLTTPYFTPEMNYMRLAIAWVQLAVMLIMFFVTLRSFRAVRIDLKNHRTTLLLAAGWAGVLALYSLKSWGYSLIYQSDTLNFSLGIRLLLRAGDLLVLVAFMALLIATIRGLLSLWSSSSHT